MNFRGRFSSLNTIDLKKRKSALSRKPITYGYYEIKINANARVLNLTALINLSRR